MTVLEAAPAIFWRRAAFGLNGVASVGHVASAFEGSITVHMLAPLPSDYSCKDPIKARDESVK